MEKTISQIQPPAKAKYQLFLDTNVIMSRACEYENNHHKCKKILTSKYNIYTSKTVKRELKKLVRRRKDYRDKLILWKYESKDSKQQQGINKYLKQISFNRNDLRFLKRIRVFLLKEQRGRDWIGMYQLHVDLIETRIEECLEKEIIKPLLPVVKDRAAFKSLLTIITNSVDCQIVLDMMFGIKKRRQQINFITDDYNDIIQQNAAIQRWYTTFFKQTGSFLEILSVSEAVKRIT